MRTIWADKVAANTWDLGGELLCIQGVPLTDANEVIEVAGGDDYAQVAPNTANRTKQMSKTGAAAGRLVSFRIYVSSPWTITIVDSLGNPIHTIPADAVGVYHTQFVGGATDEWKPAGWKGDLT